MAKGRISFLFTPDTNTSILSKSAPLLSGSLPSILESRVISNNTPSQSCRSKSQRFWEKEKRFDQDLQPNISMQYSSFSAHQPQPPLHSSFRFLPCFPSPSLPPLHECKSRTAIITFRWIYSWNSPAEKLVLLKSLPLVFFLSQKTITDYTYRNSAELF